MAIQQTRCTCGRRLADVVVATGTVVLVDTCRKCKEPIQITITPQGVKVEKYAAAPALAR